MGKGKCSTCEEVGGPFRPCRFSDWGCSGQCDYSRYCIFLHGVSQALMY